MRWTTWPTPWTSSRKEHYVGKGEGRSLTPSPSRGGAEIRQGPPRRASPNLAGRRPRRVRGRVDDGVGDGVRSEPALRSRAIASVGMFVSANGAPGLPGDPEDHVGDREADQRVGDLDPNGD